MAQANGLNGGVADLLFITDATASMASFLTALNASLPEIIHMSVLTGAFSRIGVLAYRDYCDGDLLLEWSGWCDMADPDEACSAGEHPRDKRISQSKLVTFARGIRCTGGGDPPEAGKTALAMAHEVMREGATTVTILYTDAPPHIFAKGHNGKKEEASLNNASYGGFGNRFREWTSACRTMAGGAGKKAVVHCVIDRGNPAMAQTYAFLSETTGGVCLELEGVREATISRLTVGVLLAWMGAEKPGDADREVLAWRKYFLNPQCLGELISETHFSIESACSGRLALRSEKVCVGDLYDPSRVRPLSGPALNFAERYATDDRYKSVATAQLRNIINANPAAMAANPIFGKLWRVVSGDRSNAARDELIQLFGLRAEEIRDADEKARLKKWLRESYDFTEEIMERIKRVPEEEQFPCVYLDPTQSFTSDAVDDDDNRPLNEFTRDELLAIGRSCDHRILRRLGKVLTRLTYVKKAEDLPQHIRAAGLGVVPRIPLALAQKEYEKGFWRVLLHLVLPGTMLARRPAALLAALSLRMGIQPLREVADVELLGYQKFWNTLDIPETWNLGCLNLLLDADDDFQRRVGEGQTNLEEPASLLLEDDKRLFKTLVDYKMLELNLQTNLTASVGWTPKKTKMDLGPRVICRECEYPRSVTTMSADNVCGLCVRSNSCQCPSCTKTDDHERRLHAHVSKDDGRAATGTWVECRVTSCRAQYVVYNPAALNVQPKCFYCRHGSPKEPTRAPIVECRKCLNRMIYPEEYRPLNFDTSAWECVACVTGRETLVQEETTPQKLMQENGRDWLLVVKEGVISDPLNGRSLYHTASTSNLAALPANLTIIPEFPSVLSLASKPLHNTDSLKASLRSWVLSRRTQSGECTLCFSPTRKTDLRPACGRTGCRQLICDPCRAAWYSLNAPGKLINVAALGCPFCRRMPAPGMVSRFGITRMGDARVAVQEVGEWIYAWCFSCGFAKRYAERVCERAVPAGIRNWLCEPCDEARAELLAGGFAGADAMEGVEGPGLEKPKTCPGCGVMTEKTMGCDHISCPCGVHWCYACGEEERPETIYEHMAAQHGGLWGDDDDIP